MIYLGTQNVTIFVAKNVSKQVSRASGKLSLCEALAQKFQLLTIQMNVHNHFHNCCIIWLKQPAEQLCHPFPLKEKRKRIKKDATVNQNHVG